MKKWFLSVVRDGKKVFSFSEPFDSEAKANLVACAYRLVDAIVLGLDITFDLKYVVECMEVDDNE